MLVFLTLAVLITSDSVANCQTTGSSASTVASSSDDDVSGVVDYQGGAGADSASPPIVPELPQQRAEVDDDAIDPELAKQVNENTINDQLEGKYGEFHSKQMWNTF